jgi:adenylate kinase
MSFVITGNPGVGKHTIANRISEILDIPILDINEIAKESGLFEKNNDTNDVDVEILGKVLETKLTEPSLIVGHIAPYVIPANKITKAIVLRKNPYDLMSVYEKRGYSIQKIKDNIGSEILGVILYDSLEKFGAEKTLQVNVTSKSIEEVTKKVADIIQGEIFTEEVDWLSEVSEKNDLEKFFAY